MSFLSVLVTEGSVAVEERRRLAIVRVTGIELDSPFAAAMVTVPVYTPAARPSTSTPTSSWLLGTTCQGDSVIRNQTGVYDVAQFTFRLLSFETITAWLGGFDPPSTAVKVRLSGLGLNATAFGTVLRSGEISRVS